MGIAEAHLFQNVPAPGVAPGRIGIHSFHPQLLKGIPQHQPLRLGAVAPALDRVILQMDAHAALAFWRIDILQLTFAHDPAVGQNGKEISVRGGIGVKLPVGPFRTVDKFIIMADGRVVLKFFIKLMAQLPGHGFQCHHRLPPNKTKNAGLKPAPKISPYSETSECRKEMSEASAISAIHDQIQHEVHSFQNFFYYHSTGSRVCQRRNYPPKTAYTAVPVLANKVTL